LQAVPFITQALKDAGKKTGVITTKAFTDATPAAFGTQNEFRDNESQISTAMINNGLLDVIIAPDHPEFGSGGVPRTRPSNYRTISTGDFAALRAGTAGGANPWTLVEDSASLKAIAAGTQAAPERLFGLVPVGGSLNSRNTAGQTNAYDPRIFDPANPNGAVPFVMPDLAELALAGINSLKNDPDGFFAMIEGASVDSAAHANNLPQLVEEQLAFNRSVDSVIKWIETESSWEETLLIVTTDHANGLFLGPDSASQLFQDPIATGVGQLPQGIFWTTNHTNELVPMWTRGPGSDLFGGLVDGIDPRRGAYIDNTDIHTVMTAVIPEPASLPIMGLAGGLLIRRRT
jgi:alkaline phosphatase